MASIFSKIIVGDIPSYKILEDDNFIAILDAFPLVAGHCLVIPKNETDYIFDMDDTSLGEIMIFAKKVAKAIKLSVHCTKIGVSVVGLEVPHAHIHLIPIVSVSDMNFSKPKLKLTDAEMQKISDKIKSKLT
jgi:histidine triad (HIT) family protein